MAGKKVLMLEFDLSNPSLSEKLHVPESKIKGLSEYLKGEVEKEKIIKRTDIHENLYIISAGNLPENPSELIMDKRVQELLDYVSEDFDNIIIDTAPVGPVIRCICVICLLRCCPICYQTQVQRLKQRCSVLMITIRLTY